MDIKTKEDSPMSEEFGPNFITLTDEDGNDITNPDTLKGMREMVTKMV